MDLPSESFDHSFKTGKEHSNHQDSGGRGYGESKLKIDFMRGGGNGFRDVAGLDDIKAKMTRNFISIVKNPELARTFRIEPPNGLLLWGPPGNGKSFISKKLAEESGLLYATVNPGDLGSIFIHGTQGLIADLFTKCERMAAKEKSGVLLVIEEFDSLVPSRSASTGDSNSRNDEVAEFLTRLNNCASKGVYVIATTNRIDAIDPAIMRKGRMDEVIYVDMPDEQVRLKLFQLELNDRPHEDLDLTRLVKMTDGFSSGDISYLVKESARKAFEQTLANEDKSVVTITQENLEDTIGHAHPSVTASERHKYEKLRDTYERNRNGQPRVGF
ncbi:MAG: ATP-binding protein [Duncaniella sp.]|nr:ATP-binding protein [Duncaniella sp.]